MGQRVREEEPKVLSIAAQEAALNRAFGGVIQAPDPGQPTVIRLGGQHTQRPQAPRPRSATAREAAEFGLSLGDEFDQPVLGQDSGHVSIGGGARPLAGVRELQQEDVSGPQHIYVGPGAKPVDTTPAHRFVGAQPARPHLIDGGRRFVPTQTLVQAQPQAAAEGPVGGPDLGLGDPVAGKLRQLEQELEELRATLRGAHQPRGAVAQRPAPAPPPPGPLDPWASAYPEIPEDPTPSFTISASQAAALEKLLNCPRVRSADQLLGAIQKAQGASLGGVVLDLTTAELEAVKRRAVFMGIPLELALKQMVEAVREGLLGAPLQASSPASHHEAANVLGRWNGMAAPATAPGPARPTNLGISVLGS